MWPTTAPSAWSSTPSGFPTAPSPGSVCRKGFPAAPTPRGRLARPCRVGVLEATDLPAGQRNAIGVTLGLLGDEWSLLILREALLGASRFVDWRARLPISNAVLTARLNRLTEAGLFVRGNGYRL